MAEAWGVKEEERRRKGKERGRERWQSSGR
jgi:hypothetical protein